MDILQKFDKDNKHLKIGDRVVYAISLGTDLHIGHINKFSKKLIYITSIDGYTAQRYSNKVIKI